MRLMTPSSYKKVRLNKIIMTSLIALIVGPFAHLPSSASEVGSIYGQGGPSRRNMDDTRFSEYLNRYRNEGYRMIDIDAYKKGNKILYSQQWRRNDDRDWAVEFGLDSQSYSNRFANYRNAGMRATDIEGYLDGRHLKFAGLWVENTENIGWALWRNLSSQAFRDKNREQADRGRSLVDVEAYQTRSGLRFAGIWYDNDDNTRTFLRRGLTRESYQTHVNEQTAAGMKLVDYERYENDNGDTRYIALFKSNIAGRVTVRTNRSELSYANDFRKYSDQGYRPVDFERDGNAYGGIWMQRSPNRVSFPLASDIRSLLSDYMRTNSNPFLGNSSSPPQGISAAIVMDGNVVFQGGAGMADTDAGKNAHGTTIYKLGSIAKVVGATIFARLEERGQLQNGRTVNINRSDNVRSHISGLPSQHNYTLGNLLNHSACVANYDQMTNTPSGHYDSMLEAIPEMWDVPLLSGCNLGAGRNYSNPGYAILGGAIESASGQAMKDLIRDEIANPFNLSSFRAEYAERNRVPSYDRSLLYRDGRERNSADTSWKIIVGGMESTPVDLARFGWLTGSAQITSNATLQNIRAADSTYGWRVRNPNGRSTIGHGGSSTGALTQLTVWPDQGLSIAIMSNDNGTHTNTELRNFSQQMGDTVLDRFGR